MEQQRDLQTIQINFFAKPRKASLPKPSRLFLGFAAVYFFFSWASDEYQLHSSHNLNMAVVNYLEVNNVVQAEKAKQSSAANRIFDDHERIKTLLSRQLPAALRPDPQALAHEDRANREELITPTFNDVIAQLAEDTSQPDEVRYLAHDINEQYALILKSDKVLEQAQNVQANIAAQYVK